MATVQRIVAEYEIRSPLSLGVPTRTLREGLHANEELADISIRELERDGKLEIQGPIARRRGWAPSPSASDLKDGRATAVVSDQAGNALVVGQRYPGAQGAAQPNAQQGQTQGTAGDDTAGLLDAFAQ